MWALPVAVLGDKNGFFLGVILPYIHPWELWATHSYPALLLVGEEQGSFLLFRGVACSSVFLAQLSPDCLKKKFQFCGSDERFKGTRTSISVTNPGAEKSVLFFASNKEI